MSLQRALLIDTATDRLVVGLAEFAAGEPPLLLGNKDHACRRKANVELTQACFDLLKEHNCEPENLSCVVVGRGPGSFTGVRIGLATAKGIASALPCPLQGVSTLDAMAYKAWQAGVRGKLLVLNDAMRKEVYPAWYDLEQHGLHKLSERQRVVKATDFASELASEHNLSEITCIGDGFATYQDAFSVVLSEGIQWTASDPLNYPSSEGMLLAAYYESVLASCIVGDASDLQDGNPALVFPIYTRLSDAEENERKKLGLAQTMSPAGCANELAERFYAMRPALSTDAAQLARLEQEIFHETEHTPWSEEAFFKALGDVTYTCWVAHQQETIIGYACARIADTTSELMDVAVASGARNKGVATSLLARLIYDAKVLDAHRMQLEVARTNAAAQRLYERLGFFQVAERSNYYAHKVDALIYERSLDDITDIHFYAESSSTDGAAQLTKQTTSSQTRPATVINKADQERIRATSPYILAIETSCDETAMSVIDKDGTVIASAVASQIDFHARFGGVVPEIASRKHIEAIVGVYEEVLRQAAATLGASSFTAHDIATVAVTQGPGLVGALVIGIAFAKGIVLATGAHLIGVNHLRGHIIANMLEDPNLKPPFIASVISGGHTMLALVQSWDNITVLGQTIDDAVGEAFDKVSKALGYGYPGGPIISRLAKRGNPHAIDFPRALMQRHDLRFSLSGLKTAVVTYMQKEEQAGRPLQVYDLAASFQAAVIDVIVRKALDACLQHKVTTFCVGGGVAANPALRDALSQELAHHGITVVLPRPENCTDNAIMIGLVAYQEIERAKNDPLRAGDTIYSDLHMDAEPRLGL